MPVRLGQWRRVARGRWRDAVRFVLWCMLSRLNDASFYVSIEAAARERGPLSHYRGWRDFGAAISSRDSRPVGE